MKKLSLLLAVAMVLTCFTGCGSGGSGSTGTAKREKEVGELVSEHNDGCLFFGKLWYTDMPFVFTDSATYNDGGEKYTVYYGDLVKQYDDYAVYWDYIDNHSTGNYKYNGSFTQYVREEWDDYGIYEKKVNDAEDFGQTLRDANKEIFDSLKISGKIFLDNEVQEWDFSYGSELPHFLSSLGLDDLFYVVEPDVRVYVYGSTGMEKKANTFTGDYEYIYYDDADDYDVKVVYSNGVSESYYDRFYAGEGVAGGDTVGKSKTRNYYAKY